MSPFETHHSREVVLRNSTENGALNPQLEKSNASDVCLFSQTKSQSQKYVPSRYTELEHDSKMEYDQADMNHPNMVMEGLVFLDGVPA